VSALSSGGLSAPAISEPLWISRQGKSTPDPARCIFQNADRFPLHRPTSQHRSTSQIRRDYPTQLQLEYPNTPPATQHRSSYPTLPSRYPNTALVTQIPLNYPNTTPVPAIESLKQAYQRGFFYSDPRSTGSELSRPSISNRPIHIQPAVSFRGLPSPTDRSTLSRQ
jgi:hypothetical protein